MIKTDAEILEEAAGYIDAGWAKYQEEDAHGRVCAIGALNKALFGKAESSLEIENIYTDKTTDAYRLLGIISEDVPVVILGPEDPLWESPFYLATIPKGKLYMLSAYNDYVDTRQSDISDLFKKAAKKIAEKDNVME